MINNEFYVVGVATSDIEDISNNNFRSYLVRVECERLSTIDNRPVEMSIQIYGSNNVINVKQKVLGKQVVINGFIDFYKTKDGKIINKLVAQNLYVIEREKNRIAYDSYNDDAETEDDLPY